jgi:RNase P subunit RPR2
MGTCEHYGNLTICRPGKMAEKPLRKNHRWKWCFGCRERLPHMLTMKYEIEPSYYDPLVFWKCSKCGKDRTEFC